MLFRYNYYLNFKKLQSDIMETQKERLIIKDFGPIVECDIEISPMTIFIGESGSGKSCVMKVLSMLRWVHKKMNFKSMIKRSKVKGEPFRFRLDNIIKHSGLEDYLKKASKIEYHLNDIKITISNKELNARETVAEKNLTIEKIIFIGDERYIVPSVLNSKTAEVRLSSYMKDTMSDFNRSYDAFLSGFKISSIDALLKKDKHGIRDQFYIMGNNPDVGEYRVKFENASSGTKTSAIVEIISSFYSNFYNLNETVRNNVIEYIVFKTIDGEWDPKNLKQFQKNRVSVFIEEPELSLFPTSQKKMIEFLVKTMNTARNKTEIIFSTHSPYILTTLNNLLLAKTAADENANNPEILEKINGIVPKESRLDIKDLSVYEITGGIVSSIVDTSLNMVDADKIDGVSIKSSEEFSELLEINLDSLQDE